MLRHQTKRLVQILLRIDRDEVRRRDLADRRLLGILAFSDNTDSDVAVCDRSDQLVAFDDRCEPHVLVAHHLRRVGDRLVGVDRARVVGHQFSNTLTHVVSLLVGRD